MTRTTLSINLNRIIAEKGKHLGDFVKAGVAKTTLYRTRYRNNIPNTETIMKMAQVLEVKPEQLLNRRDIETKLALMNEISREARRLKGYGATTEPKNAGRKKSCINWLFTILFLFYVVVSVVMILIAFSIYV